MRRRRAIHLPIIALAATVLALGALGGVAWAAFTSSTSASQTFATLTLGNPAAPGATITASNATSCTSITVSWTAASSADAYRIQVRENGGAWADLVTETGTVTSYADTTTHTHATVEYRIYSRDAGSNWEGPTPVQTASVTCGIALVTDAVATNPCSSSTITRSAPSGATRYDVQRRVNGGAWSTLVANQSGLTYTDPTVHALGAVVEYQVRSGTTVLDGNWSASATIASWTPFRIQSIVAGNSGTLGTLNAGDTVVITFSKPVTTSSVTNTSVTVDTSGANRGMYFAASSAATTGIGRLQTATGRFGTNATYAGGVAWGSGNTTWTWTSSVAGTTMSAALANEAFTAGSGPTCAADASALVATNAPTSSGRW